MSPVENHPFDTLQVGEEERLVHVLTKEDFSLLATQAATFGAGVVDPAVVASPPSAPIRRKAVGRAR